MEATPDTQSNVENDYNEPTPSKQETRRQVRFQPDPEKQKRGSIVTVFWKLWLIFLKNLILRKRQYIITAFEIILPTFLVIMLVILKAVVDKQAGPGGSSSKTPDSSEHFGVKESEQELLKKFSTSEYTNTYSNKTIGYSPNTEEVKKFITEELDLKITTTIISHCNGATCPIRWKGFANEKQLESDEDVRLGLIINGLEYDQNKQIKNGKISYKIRFKNKGGYKGRDDIPSTTGLIYRSDGDEEFCNSKRDDKYGKFVALQIIIDKVLTEKLLGISSDSSDYQTSTLIFPCPKSDITKKSDRNGILEYMLNTFLILSFVFVVPQTVRGIVSEKETGIKELMKMAGLSNWMHWVGWMLNSLVSLLITITIIIFLLFVPFSGETGIVVNSDFTLWWFFLFLYSIWTTTYCFLISSLFEKTTIATSVGILVWMVSLFVVIMPIFISAMFDPMGLTLKCVVCMIVPNMILYAGIRLLSQLVLKDVGGTWAAIGEPASPFNSLTFGHILIMLIVSSILNTLLALYLENVIPTTYGVRKPWYYLVLPSTWGIKGNDKPALENSAELRSKIEAQGDRFEDSPTDLPVGMEIIKLRKKFGNKISIDDVTVKAYEGQIFCLLGHNGAGKTTTMSVLTGLMAPSSGTALINGKDIRTEMNDIRQSLGLCSQTNMLFEKLTCAEHLKFFGKIKGLTNEEAKSEIPNLIKKLDLVEKTNVVSKALSGGQKRRLCLGCAIIGNSKVLFLDECSSGLDPEVRRVIWDLLMEIREGRTIILTTHFLEEAEVLADRIAIMAAGKIQCCGSSMFLKNYYGTGYTLSVSMTKEGSPDAALKNVQKQFPSAYIKSQTAKENVIEVAITLPTKDEEIKISSKFPALLTNLISQKAALQIVDVGIAPITMDEVFLKVDELGHQSANVQLSPTSTINNINDKRVSGLQLLIQQFIGLLLKKILYCMRKWILALFQFIFPMVLIVLAIILIRLLFDVDSEVPPITISLSSYDNQVVLFRVDGPTKEIGAQYKIIVGSSALEKQDELPQELLKIANEKKSGYFRKYAVAAEFEKAATTSITAMYSSVYIHSRPLSINLATNAMLRHLGPKDKSYAIEVINHPLDSGPKIINMKWSIKPRIDAGIIFGCLMSIGLGLFAATFVIMPIEEKTCQAKQLQLMTGVNPLLYWLSAFVWDYFLFLLCGVLMVICLYIFEDFNRLTNHHAAGVLFLIVAVYGFAALPFSYLISLFTKTSAGAFSLFIMFHILTGLPTALIMSTMRDWVEPKHEGFISILPPYSLTRALMNYVEGSLYNSQCNAFSKTKDIDSIVNDICNLNPTGKYTEFQNCCDNCQELKGCFQAKPYLSWKNSFYEKYQKQPGLSIGQHLLSMFIMACFYWILFFVIELGVIRLIIINIFKRKPANFVANSNDDDVQTEVQRVNDMVQMKATVQDCFVVNNLCKNYGSFSAVSKLTLGVHYGECFGLLGVNGAGKTTTFRMLTGDETASDGNAWTKNLSLLTNKNRFLQNIGYCPQFEGHIGVLSGQEMLEIFGRLRGVKNSKVKAVAKDWLNRFGLQESANDQCQNYSGGMKRRLSAAMALIGDCNVIFMDEPTSGVDPASRRQFWDIISSLKGAGVCIILTSHSMDECETLCSRLGIMVNGELQCLGRVQHLKNKFAQGYTLQIKLTTTNEPASDADLKNLSDEIIAKFYPCTLKEYHQNLVEFSIHSPDLALDKVYEMLEVIKRQFEALVDDYSIQQTTLEEVFLSFARQQHSDRKVKAKKKCCVIV